MTSCIIWIRPSAKYTVFAMMAACPATIPFVEAEKRDHASTRHTVWSIGHRTGQGLAGHPQTGAIWNSEMGPRGGDEINLIQGGGNYGWPLYTNGLDYNGEWVTIGADLGLDFPIAETVLPAVDFTPAPALSDLMFISIEAEWNGDALVGSLKAGTLYRVRIENGASVSRKDYWSISVGSAMSPQTLIGPSMSLSSIMKTDLYGGFLRFYAMSRAKRVLRNGVRGCIAPPP